MALVDQESGDLEHLVNQAAMGDQSMSVSEAANAALKTGYRTIYIRRAQIRPA